MSHTVRMAKASKDDIDRLVKFFQFIEEFMEYGTHTPENEDFEDESIELSDAEFVENLRQLWGGRFKPAGVDCAWSRVVWGCDVLIRNCCDPDLDYLDWRPDIRDLLELKESQEVAGE